MNISFILEVRMLKNISYTKRKGINPSLVYRFNNFEIEDQLFFYLDTLSQ